MIGLINCVKPLHIVFATNSPKPLCSLETCTCLIDNLLEFPKNITYQQVYTCTFCFHFIFRELTNIGLLKTFIHLRYVDVSKNNLKDISPLSALTHMLTLKADENKLSSAKLEEMPFLQVATFNNNKITSTEGINHPMLEHLSMNSKFVISFSPNVICFG